ncbi:MAG TPA: ROK family protein [Acholeplasmataceae bacterium]|jgi:predicted NBD/HSP70 family sugar kinase|nr:ROK family protein [Acholeplasmataceae bacterium]
MRYLCFDVGGTDTKYAVITEDYRIISKASFPTEINRGGADLLKRMIEIIRRAEVEGGLAGVAVSSPGIVDCDTGAVVFANERGKGFQGISYRQTIGEATGLNCWAENDANCFAWAETLDHDGDFLVVTIGTGIGGAIVLGGEVYRGINNSAGAFGQVRITDAAKWEELASLKALLDNARADYPDLKDGEELFSRHDRGEPTAVKAVAAFYRYLAVGIANLAYVFSPPKIIIGGGITTRPAFFGELTAAIKAQANPAYFGKTEVAVSRHKNDGGLIGALVHYRKRETRIKKSL